MSLRRCELSKRRWQCHKMVEGKLVQTVQRQGTPLLYIVETQGSYRPEVLTKKANSNDIGHN